MHGKLIVFEGVEGCGKTTQLQQSRQWLRDSGWETRLLEQGRSLLVTREPGGTELGSALRQLLLGQATQEPMQNRTELLLYAADRAQHVAGCLRPHLAKGGVILCDRYTDSTVAYQGYGRGLDLNLIHLLNQVATDGLESDLTLWLDLDVKTGLHRTRQRGTVDRIEQADIAFHQRVQQGFTELARSHPHRVVRIDASGSESAVAQQIQAALQQQFEQWFT